jgi:adhesin/invasin
MRYPGWLLTVFCAAHVGFAAAEGDVPAAPVTALPVPSPVAAPADMQQNPLLVSAAQLAQSMASDGDPLGTVTSRAASMGVNAAQNALRDLLPTFEMDMSFAQNNKPVWGILGVVPLHESSDHLNAVFSQLSTFRTDGRTTVNVGLGDRQLFDDDRVLLGVNAFYDYEFPYANQRTSVGAEIRTTVAELNVNAYQGQSGWKINGDGMAEKAMGGEDVELGVALPYMPQVELYGKRFQWNAYDGLPDIKGNVLSLKGSVFPGGTIEMGRTYYSTAQAFGQPDASFVTFQLDIIKLLEHPHAATSFFARQAYTLDSMRSHLYDKVRRENIIQKQVGRGFVITASGN